MTPRGPDADPEAVRDLIARLLATMDFTLERTVGGVSTEVYRISRDGGVLYLRLAEEVGDDFAVEAEVHRRLHDAGVRVPRIVHHEAVADEVGRSIMVTTEVAGRPLHECDDEPTVRRAATEVGRDVAVINGFDAVAYGWVLRDGVPWPPRGEIPSWEDWVTFGIRPEADILRGSVLGVDAFAAVQRLVDEESSRPREARLAHGDLDVTPIFVADGRYAGLIDFGEIRAAEAQYDLAHFRLQDGLVASMPSLLDDLLRGYAEISPLPEDITSQLDRTAVLIGIRQLARWVRRSGDRALDHFWVRKIRGRTEELIAKL